MKKLIFVIIYVNVLSGAKSVEYYDYQAFRLLDFGIGARAIGMGNAVVASTNNVYAVFWNPAKLTKIDGITLSASMSYLYNPKCTTGVPLGGFTKPQIAVSYSFDSYGTFGLGGYYLDYGDDVNYLYSYENIDSIPPSPGYNENIICLGYGNAITSGFGVGFSFNFHQLFALSHSDSSARTLSVSLGSYYAVSNQVILALLYSTGANVFSYNTIASDTDTIEYRIPIQKKAIFGIAYKPTDDLLFELDIKTKEIIKPFKLYIGVEYSYYPLKMESENGPIAFIGRLGIRDLLGKEKFVYKEVGNHAFTSGLGVEYKNWFFRNFLDYAIIYRPNVCGDNHFSHNINFGIGVIF